MVPLMVQEAYLGASRGGLEEAVAAADFISCGDIIDRRIHTRHDWSLLPHYVQTVVAAAKTVSGPAPFQIFPQWLGKNSKRLKHRRYLDGLSSKLFCSNDDMRLDYADAIQSIVLQPLCSEKPDIKGVIGIADSIRFTRDDLFESLQEVVFDKIEIPTKTRTAFTREYNKAHPPMKGEKGVKKRKADEMSDDEDDEVGDGVEVSGLEEGLELLEI
jgi:hypothetical protein